MDLFSQTIYKDKYLLLIGVPLAVLLLQHVGLSWTDIQKSWSQAFYWYNLLFNLVTVVLAVLLHRALVIYSDRRLPYESNFGRRVCLQLLLSVVLLLLFAETMSYVYIRWLMNMDYWEGH